MVYCVDNSRADVHLHLILTWQPPNPIKLLSFSPNVLSSTLPTPSLFSRQFNAEWSKSLNAKADEETAMKTKMMQEAKAELDNWKKQQEIRVTTKKDTNRAEEKRQVEQTEAAADPSRNPWERVITLVDPHVDGSASKDTDTSRMHKLFIQLKNDPVATK